MLAGRGNRQYDKTYSAVDVAPPQRHTRHGCIIPQSTIGVKIKPLEPHVFLHSFGA